MELAPKVSKGTFQSKIFVQENYALDIRRTTEFSLWDLDYFERAVGPQVSTVADAYEGVPLVTGRLCQVIEGGGKRRLFAICNSIKQRLLSPVHDWAFKVLSRIRTDVLTKNVRCGV